MQKGRSWNDKHAKITVSVMKRWGSKTGKKKQYGLKILNQLGVGVDEEEGTFIP